MHSIKNAFVVLVDPDRGVYAVRHAGTKKWMLPGGTFDAKKDTGPKATATRELHEETGIMIPKHKLEKLGVSKDGSTECFLVHLMSSTRYTKALNKRSDPDETDAFGFAVWPQAFEFPVVVKSDGMGAANGFELRQNGRRGFNWRRGSKEFLDRARGYFPSMLHVWKTSLGYQNTKLKGSSEQAYIDFVLARCAQSSPSAVTLQGTKLYRQGLEVALKWKQSGFYSQDQLDKYTTMIESMERVAAMFRGYPLPINGYRADDSHLDPSDRLAWPVSLCSDGFKSGSNAKRYLVDPGVMVFPIFIYDRLNQAYNECEIVALRAHNKLTSAGYMLTKFNPVSALPEYAQFGFDTQEAFDAARRAAMLTVGFADLAVY